MQPDYSILYQGVGVLVLVLVLWTIPWKGVALWKAARAGSVGWFIAILLLNTLAILEILYIFIFSKKKAATATNDQAEQVTVQGTNTRPEAGGESEG